MDFGGGEAARQFSFQRGGEGVVCIRCGFVEQAQLNEALVVHGFQVAFEDGGDGGFLFGGHDWFPVGVL